MQWEFAGQIGPEAGRYVIRRYAGDDARHVVVIGDLEAPRRRRLGRGRPKRAAPGAEPGAVEVTRATVITTDPLPEDGAAAWLDAAVRDRDATVGDALALLNRTIHGHRLAARDPYVAEVSADQALATRIGYGSGEQVADGDWEAARELPPPKPPRSMLNPQQRLAALLSGRDVALACEELALRARLDLDQGREREAALQLTAALDAAFAELEGWRGTEAVARRLDELHEHREAVDAAARAALEGGLQDEHTEAVEAALGRREATLRARIASLSWGAGRRSTSTWRSTSRPVRPRSRTLGGYSTIWLARALPPDGRLVTLEADAHHARVARENLARAGLATLVEVVEGPALETLPRLAGPFDLVFIDADKERSADYLALALERSRPGTLIVAVNVVRGGALVDADSDDPRVVGSRRLVEAVAAEPRLLATGLQTVGVKGWDGMVVALVV